MSNNKPIVISAIPLSSGTPTQQAPTATAAANEPCSWSLIDEASETFLKFLQEGEKKSKNWHVIFKMGTVARIEAKSKEFAGYETSTYKIPEHRVPNKKDRKDMLRENKAVWQKQKAIPGEIGKAVRQGYEMLIGDGYPFPGGEGA